MDDYQPRPYTLSDVWNAAKTERNFNYAFWFHIVLDIIIETLVRNAGYFLVGFACILIITISIFGFFVVIPAIAEPWSLWFMFNVIWGMFMLFSIAFNYFMAVTTKPGKPCDEMHSIYRDSVPSDSERMCKKCNFVKPGRTHHCSVCKSCVMKMDHHCPWLSNCVGYKNYRYFVSFLIWVTITTSYVALVCSPQVLRPGSVLFPDADENFSVSSAIINTFLRPNFTKINLYASVTSFIDWESKALDRESAERKKIVGNIVKNSIVDNEPPAEERRRLDNSLIPEYESSIAPINRQLSERQRQQQRRHVSAHDHTKLKLNSSLYYKIVNWKEYVGTDFLMFFTFVLSLGVTVGTGILMWFHLFLICKGQSTLEYFEGQQVSARLRREGRVYVNPYDRGSLLKNFQQVFGEVPWYMMLLPSTREPPPYYLCLSRGTFPCGHTLP